MTNQSKSLICLLTISCLSLPTALLAVDPPPDGGYPNQNTAEGEDALFTGGHIGANTAVGYHALYSDNFGASNTAVGSNALLATDGAYFNTGIGADALSSDTYAGYNTAVGYSALNGITGFAHSDNVAVGYRAMAVGDAYSCVAIGSRALEINKGQLNTALGKGALQENTSGAQNTACGWSAMVHNITGLNNIAVGAAALANNTSGSNNVALGNNSGINLVSGNDNLDFSNAGAAGDQGVIRIGTEGTQTATYIAGIMTSPLASALAIGVNPSGRLGVRASSARFKEAIEPMAHSSEAIYALKPVKFRYRKELDPAAAPQFGLVAEEVEKVDPELVARDDAGRPFTVRYDEVNTMLLNEFLKEHRKVEALQDAMSRQQKAIEKLESDLAAQAAQIRRVSAQPTGRLSPGLVSSGD